LLIRYEYGYQSNSYYKGNPQFQATALACRPSDAVNDGSLAL